MHRVSLDDLKIEGLRQLAAKLNEAQDGTADEIKSRIAAKLASAEIDQPPVIFNTGPVSRWQIVLNVVQILGVLGVIGSLVGAIVSLRTLNNTEARNVESELERRKLDWQRVIVYDIIQQGTSKKVSVPLTFSQIRSKYLEEARTAKDVRVTEEDIQPLTLKQILLDLLSLNLIYEVRPEESEPRYSTRQVVLTPHLERAIAVTPAKYEVLEILTAEGGKHTSTELAVKIADKFKLSISEARSAIVDLIVLGAVGLDKNGKLWSADKPPPADLLPSTPDRK